MVAAITVPILRGAAKELPTAVVVVGADGFEKAPSQADAAWSDGTSAMDMRKYEGVEVQITAYTAAVSFTRSLDGTTYIAVNVMDAAFNPTATATAVGFYTVRGGGYLKWTGTATLTIRGYN